MSKQYSQLLTPQTLLVEEERIVYTYLGNRKIIVSEKYLPDDAHLKEKGGHHISGTAEKKPISTLIVETNRIIARTMENYLNQMISQCAITLCTPHSKAFPSPASMKKGLSPSLRNIVTFVDRNQSIWDSVLRYLKPIKESIMSGRELVFANHEPAAIYFLAWNIYMLILGLRNKSQVVSSPKSSSEIIKLLLRVKGLSREAKARLSMLNGIFNSFESLPDIGGFQIRPDVSSNLIHERMEEILEDAHLLEASKLRRFLSYQANKASLIRDLRKITNYITKNLPWAKGIFKAVEFMGYLGSQNAISEILDFFPSRVYDRASPIFISPVSHLKALMDNQSDKTIMVLLNCEGDSCGIHYVNKLSLSAYKDDFFQVPFHPFL